MSDLKIVTMRALVREDDVDEVNEGCMQLLIHGPSLSGYCEILDLTDEDRRTFADVIDDCEQD